MGGGGGELYGECVGVLYDSRGSVCVRRRECWVCMRIAVVCMRIAVVCMRIAVVCISATMEGGGGARHEMESVCERDR